MQLMKKVYLKACLCDKEKYVFRHDVGYKAPKIATISMQSSQAKEMDACMGRKVLMEQVVIPLFQFFCCYLVSSIYISHQPTQAGS